MAEDDREVFRGFLSRGAPGPHYYVILLGLKTYELPALLRRVQRGFSFHVLERLHRNVELEIDAITELVQISPRTLTRRKKEGRFLPDESDRLVRASRLFAKALELFEGNTDAARDWLSAPQTALGGAVPLDFARTELGLREVETVLDRLEQGVYS
jgi:putative toxin-antitoxin system antitoxin component (TIGR02293 family)